MTYKINDVYKAMKKLIKEENIKSEDGLVERIAEEIVNKNGFPNASGSTYYVPESEMEDLLTKSKEQIESELASKLRDPANIILWARKLPGKLDRNIKQIENYLAKFAREIEIKHDSHRVFRYHAKRIVAIEAEGDPRAYPIEDEYLINNLKTLIDQVIEYSDSIHSSHRLNFLIGNGIKRKSSRIETSGRTNTTSFLNRDLGRSLMILRDYAKAGNGTVYAEVGCVPKIIVLTTSEELDQLQEGIEALFKEYDMEYKELED